MNFNDWLGTFSINSYLTSKKFVKILQYFKLTFGYLVLANIEPYRVWLAAAHNKVILVKTSSTPTPSPIHQHLVILHPHVLRVDIVGRAPILWSFTVTTLVSALWSGL